MSEELRAVRSRRNVGMFIFINSLSFLYHGQGTRKHKDTIRCNQGQVWGYGTDGRISYSGGKHHLSRILPLPGTSDILPRKYHPVSKTVYPVRDNAYKYIVGINQNVSLIATLSYRHSRENGNPVPYKVRSFWIPAFPDLSGSRFGGTTGMTDYGTF